KASLRVPTSPGQNFLTGYLLRGIHGSLKLLREGTSSLIPGLLFKLRFLILSEQKPPDWSCTTSCAKRESYQFPNLTVPSIPIGGTTSGSKYEYDHNDRKQRHTTIQETGLIRNRWQERLEIVDCSSGKERPKTLYAFVIITGMPKSYRPQC